METQASSTKKDVLIHFLGNSSTNGAELAYTNAMNLSETAFFNITLKDFLEQGGHSPETLVDPSLSIQEALSQLATEKKELLLVGLKDSSKMGIFSETELVQAIMQGKQTVGEVVIMDQKPLSIEQTLVDGLIFFHSFARRNFCVHNSETSESFILTVKDFLYLIERNFKAELESYRLVLPKDPSFTIQDESEVSLPQNDASANLFLVPLGRLIKPNPLKFKGPDSVYDCLMQMSAARVEQAIVVEYETQLIGIFTERDFFKMMLKNPNLTIEELKEIPIEKLMTPNPHCFTIRHNMAQALRNMSHFGYRQVIVNDDEKIPVGMVSMLGILSFISRYF